MPTGKQALTKSKVIVGGEDKDAAERIMARHPTVKNLTDAVRYAIHFTDRSESEVMA